MPVRAVLFDLGNTLWHIPNPPPVQKVREETVGRIFGLLRSWGVEPQGELRFMGRDIRLAITAADKAAYEDDAVSPDFHEIVGKVAAERGLSLTNEQIEQLWHAWNLPGSFFGRRLHDDAIETLETLRSGGYRLGCVTNRPFSGPGFFAEVEELGLDGYFEALSISCDVGYMKPHRAIYEHALDALAVAPDEAAMVGDSLRADVAGAQALGMIGIWRRPHKPLQETVTAEPDYAIDELGELLHLPPFSDLQAAK